MKKPGGFRPVDTLNGEPKRRRILDNGVARQTSNKSHDHDGKVFKRGRSTALDGSSRKKRQRPLQAASPDPEAEQIEDSMNEEDMLNREASPRPYSSEGREFAASPAPEPWPSWNSQAPIRSSPYRSERTDDGLGSSKEYQSVEATVRSDSYVKEMVNQKRKAVGQRAAGTPSGSGKNMRQPKDLVETGTLKLSNYFRSGHDGECEENSPRKLEASSRRKLTGSDFEIQAEKTFRTPQEVPKLTTRDAAKPQKTTKLWTRPSNVHPESDKMGPRSRSVSVSSTEDVLATGGPVKSGRGYLGSRNHARQKSKADGCVPPVDSMGLIQIDSINAGLGTLKHNGMSISLDIDRQILELYLDGERNRAIVPLTKITRATCGHSQDGWGVRLWSSLAHSDFGKDLNVIDIESSDEASYEPMRSIFSKNLKWDEKPFDHVQRMFKHRENQKLENKSSQNLRGNDSLDVDLIRANRRKGRRDEASDLQLKHFDDGQMMFKRQENQIPETKRSQNLRGNDGLDVEMIQTNSGEARQEEAPKLQLENSERRTSSRKLSKALRENLESDEMLQVTVEVPAKEDHDREISKQTGRPSNTEESCHHMRTRRADAAPELQPKANTEPPKDKLIPYSQRCGLGPRWKRPLLYPKSGKGAVTVNFDDLFRLDEEEYLNDSLVEFYLKYSALSLEKLHPEIAKKVYWFNTYFFSSLTKGRPGKGINFDAVKKWTRSVDLFDFQYVLVPINEANHWYLAIICNLSKLGKVARKTSEEVSHEGSSLQPIGLDGTEKYVGIDSCETPSEDAVGAEIPDLATWMQMEIEQSTRPKMDIELETLSDDEILDNPKLAQIESNRFSPDQSERVEQEEFEDSQELEYNAARSSDRKLYSQRHPERTTGRLLRQGSSKKKKVRPRTYDPNETAIITLDSMGGSHPTTTRALKSYLLEEAKDKKGAIHFEDTQIKGLTAKGIPYQSNYWDCGLYLLGYVDKFIENPEQFVRKILMREFDEERDWPELIPSGMRDQMRNLIFTLHREQVAEHKSRKHKLARVSDQGPLAGLASLGKEMLAHPSDNKVAAPTTESLRRNGKQAQDNGQDLDRSKLQPEDIKRPYEEFMMSRDTLSKPMESFSALGQQFEGEETLRSEGAPEEGSSFIIPDSQESMVVTHVPSPAAVEGTRVETTESMGTQNGEHSRELHPVLVGVDTPNELRDMELPGKRRRHVVLPDVISLDDN